MNFILSLFVSLAFAQSGSKDWKLVRETDAVLQVPVCRAFTQVAANLPIPVELSLSFPTQFDRAPMMILKVPGNSGISRAVVPLTSREQEDFLVFQAVSDPSETDKLWYVPIQMEKLVDIIIGNNFLPVKFTKDGKESSGRISLSGSAATMNQVATCLKSNTILPTKFFRELNTAAGTAVLGEDQSVQQLIKYVDDAFAIFKAIAKTEDDLKKLRDANKGLLQQEADASKKLESAQINLDRAQAAADGSRAKIANGEERLRRIPGEIAEWEAKKPAAEQLFEQKKAAFEPLRVRAQELQSDINSAQRRVDVAEANINRAQSSIRNGEAKLRELEREADVHMRTIREIDNDLPDLQRRESDLQVQLSSYSVENEKQKILSRDSGYQRLRQEKNQTEQELRQKRGELQFAQRRLREAEEDLRRCKAKPNPQCSNEENAVQRGQGEVRRLDGEVDQLQSRLRNIDWQMQRSEEQAERQAQAGRDRLVNELREVSSELAEARAKRESASNRLRDIQGFEIPRYQREVRDAQNDLPILRRQLSQFQSDFNRAVTELREYKASVQYDRIKKEFDEAKRALDDINGEIVDRRTEERQIQRDLPGWRTTLANQEKEVLRLTPIRDAARTKLEGIQAQLAQFRQEEKTFLDSLAVLRPQYDELRKLYQTLATLLLQP